MKQVLGIIALLSFSNFASAEDWTDKVWADPSEDVFWYVCADRLYRDYLATQQDKINQHLRDVTRAIKYDITIPPNPYLTFDEYYDDMKYQYSTTLKQRFMLTEDEANTVIFIAFYLLSEFVNSAQYGSAMGVYYNSE